MESFEGKIVYTRPRKRENKDYRFVPFLSDTLQKILKKQKKNSKNKKILLWLHFKRKSVERR